MILFCCTIKLMTLWPFYWRLFSHVLISIDTWLQIITMQQQITVHMISLKTWYQLWRIQRRLHIELTTHSQIWQGIYRLLYIISLKTCHQHTFLYILRYHLLVYTVTFLLAMIHAIIRMLEIIYIRNKPSREFALRRMRNWLWYSCTSQNVDFHVKRFLHIFRYIPGMQVSISYWYNRNMKTRSKKLTFIHR